MRWAQQICCASIAQKYSALARPESRYEHPEPPIQVRDLQPGAFGLNDRQLLPERDILRDEAGAASANHDDGGE